MSPVLQSNPFVTHQQSDLLKIQNMSPPCLYPSVTHCFTKNKSETPLYCQQKILRDLATAQVSNLISCHHPPTPHLHLLLSALQPHWPLRWALPSCPAHSASTVSALLSFSPGSCVPLRKPDPDPLPKAASLPLPATTVLCVLPDNSVQATIILFESWFLVSLSH